MFLIIFEKLRPFEQGAFIAFRPFSESFYCPRRVLAQAAKTRGDTLEAPAHREENFAVPEKISIF